MATISDFEQNDQTVVDRLISKYGSLQGILFLLPAFFLLGIVLFYPMIFNGILLSFKQYTVSPDQINPWLGLENYKYWLIGGGQALFLFSIKMTLLYELVVIPLDLIMALGAALVVNESLPARPFWRGIMLAGYASPAMAAGIVFAFMEQAAVYGVVYKFLDVFFKIPSQGGMVSNTPWAFWGIVIAKVWRDFGFMYVTLLAGVQSVPSELYEIAKVDGAGPVQRFRHITLPHLRTLIITVVMIRTVFTVGNIDIPVAITQGGPLNYTTFLGVLIFQKAFTEFNMGKAAALGVMFSIALIPLILIWVYFETGDS